MSPSVREVHEFYRCDWQAEKLSPNNQRDICRERRRLGGSADGWVSVRFGSPYKNARPSAIATFCSREHVESWLAQLVVDDYEWTDPRYIAVMDSDAANRLGEALG